MNYKAEVCNYFNGQGIKYQEIQENTIRMEFTADAKGSVDIVIFFDDPGDKHIHFLSPEIAKVSEDKFVPALMEANKLNSQFRWAKFSISDENRFDCEADAILDANSCGEECLELVIRLVKIVDTAYPEIMKVVWG